MTGWTTPVRRGLPVSFDGEQFTIAEIDGSRVMLRPAGTAGGPSWRQVDLVARYARPGSSRSKRSGRPGRGTQS